jgi:Fe-S cluster assembly protein SufB
MTTTAHPELEGIGRYEYGWADSDVAGSGAKRGLNEAVVRDISAKKDEPQWMLDLRLKGLRLYDRKPLPTWGADLSTIDFDNIKYFVRSTEKQATSWEELPEDIKNTYDRLGIPEAEKQRLVAGVAAQYESEVVYHQIREDLEEQGVLFLDTDTALREQPELFQEYFGSVIPVGDNKFAALNTAVWSGGSFIYVPKGVQGRHPAAGVLPHQHREHGPVRADADHRRRGRLRALRRGLHRADLLERLAALRGRRDHRQEGRAVPLHDHPELVEQRLQPGHQAATCEAGARWSGSTATSAPRSR